MDAVGTVRATGRLPFVADPRDESYTATRLAAMVEMGLARDVEWGNANPALDQGDYGTCVAAGTLGLLNTDHEQHNDPRFTSRDILPFFKTIAGHGPLPQGGAEVREGLKAAKAAGLITAYALLRTESEIDEWLRDHGPVLVGTAWTKQMMTPQGDLVVVDSTVSDMGHCWFFHGSDLYYLGGSNSWGTVWADHGMFRIRRTHWVWLHKAGGEAWAVVQPVAPPKLARPSLWSRISKLFGGK